MQVFKPIQHARTADEVAHQIEALILEGVLRVGERLPGERELANETGVSRPIVREALKSLEVRGIIESRHGEGTFVADIIGTVFTPQISGLLASHRKATFDYLEYRREVEGVTARLAAMRATPADRELLSELIGRMAAAFENDDFEAEALIDVEFHSLIGEIAHNLVLLHTLRSCYRLLSEGVFQNRHRLYQAPGGRDLLYRQHCAIADAILAGDGEKAMEASRKHMDFVMEATRELEQREERERISSLRLAQREEMPNRGKARKQA
ncbi:MAG: FadR/GntR family transcriptional regulator [Nitratireductor sp.]|nr:FadR family transcriptional regulator [Nitratireductor sp.]